MKKLLFVLSVGLIGSQSVFAQFRSFQSVNMGQWVQIDRKFAGRAVSAKWTSAPAAVQPNQNFYNIDADTRFLEVDVEIANRSMRSDDFEYEDLVLIAGDGGVQQIVGWPMQIFSMLGSSQIPQNIKGEVILDSNATASIKLVFAVAGGATGNLFLAFDDDGGPRTALTVQ